MSYRYSKDSNSKSDLQTSTRSLAVMPFDRPYMIFYFHYNYVSIVHRFRDVITYFPKFKDIA